MGRRAGADFFDTSISGIGTDQATSTSDRVGHGLLRVRSSGSASASLSSTPRSVKARCRPGPAARPQRAQHPAWRVPMWRHSDRRSGGATMRSARHIAMSLSRLLAQPLPSKVGRRACHFDACLLHESVSSQVCRFARVPVASLKLPIEWTRTAPCCWFPTSR